MAAPSPSEFDDFADDYDAALRRGISVSGETKDFFARGRLRWVKRTLDRLNVQPSVILDYGCGTGSAAPYFREFFQPRQIIGVDISAKSLDVAQTAHGSARTNFSLFKDYTPNSECDLAFCNGVFHHIPVDQRAPAMDYIYRAVRPGGFFALWENNPWNPGARLIMHRIPFDRDAIMLWPAETRRRMRAAGFEILDTDFLFIFPSMLRFLRGLEPALCRLPLGAQYMVLGRRP